MSLLVNDIISNRVLQTSFSGFEREKGKDNEKTIFLLLSFKTKQKLLETKIPFFSLIEDSNKNNRIKFLNKNYLKNYLSFLKLAKKKNNCNEFIQYVIHISILKNNTMIHVTNTKGQLKFFSSASFSLKLSGKQKTVQPKVLIALTKYLLNTAYFFKNNNYYNDSNKNKENLSIALHSKYINRNLLKLIVVRLKKKLSIKTINFSNFYPHNGCRNKKTKRLKRRKNNKKTKKPFVYTDSNKKIWKSFIQPSKITI